MTHTVSVTELSALISTVDDPTSVDTALTNALIQTIETTSTIGVIGAVGGFEISVSDYGAIGDGVADDTSSLVAAIAAAGSTRRLISTPGKTYLISSTITAVADQEWSFAGSTIKKAASMTTNIPALVFVGGNYVENLVVDGNRAAGTIGHGINCTGAGNVFFNVTSEHHKYNAFCCLSGDTTYIACTANDIDDTLLAGSANGFVGNNVAPNAGIIKCIGCRAVSCGRAGFGCYNVDGHYIEGSAYLCGYGAEIRNCDNGYVNVVSTDSLQAGSRFLNAIGWTGTVKAIDTGLTSADDSASSCEITTSSMMNLNVIGIRQPGYGLNLTGVTDSFFQLHMDFDGGWDADPGLHMGSGCLRNRVTGFVRFATWGAILGEGVGANNDNNYIDLYCVECTWGALIADRATFNHFRITARDCYTTSTTYDGLCTFWSANSTDNVVEWIDQRATGTKPTYVVRFRDSATRNVIVDGYARDYVTAQVLDSVGTNLVHPAAPAVGTLRTTP